MNCTPNVRQKSLTFGGIFMSKYTSEFKLEVVKYYLTENCGYRAAANHFNITTCSLVKEWIRKYNTHGSKGLMKNNIKYDGNFKINVVEYMHTNHLSLLETIVHFNIGCVTRVGKWERIYYEEGPQALFKEQRGRKNIMNSKPNKKKLSKETEKDLIEEIQQSRMENAYLKKLQALVQERVKRENQKKHKPSQN